MNVSPETVARCQTDVKRRRSSSARARERAARVGETQSSARRCHCDVTQATLPSQTLSEHFLHEPPSWAREDVADVARVDGQHREELAEALERLLEHGRCAHDDALAVSSTTAYALRRVLFQLAIGHMRRARSWHTRCAVDVQREEFLFRDGALAMAEPTGHARERRDLEKWTKLEKTAMEAKKCKSTTDARTPAPHPGRPNDALKADDLACMRTSSRNSRACDCTCVPARNRCEW